MFDFLITGGLACQSLGLAWAAWSIWRLHLRAPTVWAVAGAISALLGSLVNMMPFAVFPLARQLGGGALSHQAAKIFGFVDWLEPAGAAGFLICLGMVLHRAPRSGGSAMNSRTGTH